MKPIAFVLGADYEDAEFQQPYDFLRENGCEVHVIGTEKGQTLRGKRGQSQVQTTHEIEQVEAADYDALVIPGGYSPDKLRMNKKMVDFVRTFFQADRPVFAICHAGQLLIEADAVRGKKMAAWPSIWTDLKNAGATVVDEPLVQDGNLYTSRKPDDLPQFNQALAKALNLAVREKAATKK